MKPFDKQHDPTTKSIPELMQHLWTLYMEMSLDPALAEPAAHIREAALSLEKTRRLAHEVLLEAEETQTPPMGKRKQKRSAEEKAALEWLRTARTISQSKH